jgi:WD40-like Beta Propeller Repeat
VTSLPAYGERDRVAASDEIFAVSRAGTFRAAAVSAVALAAAMASTANANVIAAVDQPAGSGRTDLDVALYDTSTGLRIALPAGVNTADDELHPSLTPDGRLLVFERRNDSAGTVRIVIVELATGKSADLFSGFETSSVPPTSPAITPDGKTVLTGRPGPPGDFFEQLLTVTDVSTFPAETTGPFPHSDFDGGQNGGSGGQVFEPAVGIQGLVAWQPRVPGLAQGITLSGFGRSIRCLLDDPQSDYSQPALPAASSDHMLFVVRDLPGGAPHPGDIWFWGLNPESSCGATGAPAELPTLINTSNDESRPALTPDGRYVGFVRHSSTDQHSRLFVWDSLTQLLVNNSGIDLGKLSVREIDLVALRGNLSLRATPVLRTTGISLSGLVTAQLLTGARIGIIVQRVVGHHRLFRHVVPTLRTVGRVPLGSFRRGHLRVRWNRSVDGRRLRRGLYQVTVRALARNGRVEDLGRPRLLRIR